MTPLLILGAGGFARETAELVRAVNGARPTWDLLGYLDDDPALHGTVRTAAPVLGSLEAVHEHSDAMVVACLGSPRAITVRQRVVERLGLTDERWATLVHPTAVVPDSVRLGVGTVVHAGTIFTADVEVGRHVEIMPGVIMTHDDRVADYATFGSGVRLAGGVTIGRSAYIGSGAMVREDLEVGSEAVVGMGSVVTRCIPPNTTWAGVPAAMLHPPNEPLNERD